LTYIHSFGMVFRDLKPDNIGIAVDGTIKLFDFGLCRDIHDLIKRRRYDPLYRMSSVGTRRYMSPEVISGYCYSQKTDVYSWSMMFFEILSLQKPYAKYNRSLHKILVCENKGRPYPSMDIPWNSRNLLKRGWAQNSFDRPTIKEIYDELCPMIETVEQQVLPINERSLRAV
ncbi:kinase-like protein, partial [Fragilariopsis cylindrus CCMP1102]